MISAKKLTILGVAPVVFMLLLSACTFSQPTDPPSISAQKVLEQCIKNMRQLKSAHMDDSASGSVSKQAGFNMVANGDEALPNASSTQVTLNHGAHMQEVIQGNKVYWTTGGSWYVVDKSRFGYQSSFSGLNSRDLDTFLAALTSHSRVDDKGEDIVNGEKLRHITIVITDNDGLRQLLENDKQLQAYPALSALLSKQNINTLLRSLKNSSATVDLWIDETNFFVHRSVVNLSLNTVFSVAVNFNSTTNLSKFNQTVVPRPPAHATPLGDSDDLL